MPTVIAHHKIKDKKVWLASKKRAEFFEPLGVTNIRTFVDPQDPTRVAVMMDIPNLETVMTALQTQAAADTMAADGVLTETLVMLVEE